MHPSIPASTIEDDIEDVARRARQASLKLASISAEEKNNALSCVENGLMENEPAILAANEQDINDANKRLTEKTISPALVKRLDLSKKFKDMLENVDAVQELPDPNGKCSLSRQLDDGLQLYRVACPIGVICVIFEARPEVVVQIACLAIKSGNAVILKGGKEAERSNAALVHTIRSSLKRSQCPEDTVQLVATREEVRELLDQTKYIDLIIPRGSNDLVRFIQSNTKIPVMGHADGICTVYVDAKADPAKAARIVADAKAQYPAVCNAAETLLVHRSALDSVLPTVGEALAERGVLCKADEATSNVLMKVKGLKVESSKPDDYDTEFLDLIMAVKVVDNVNEAVIHINEHGSGHTDAIVTEDEVAAKVFMASVDSAGVFHNASTRFADGYRLGFGAEVGVSTHRTHARGPVGLEGLMIYKYKLLGNGHVVAPYADGKRRFTHKDTPDLQPPM